MSSLIVMFFYNIPPGYWEILSESKLSNEVLPAPDAPIINNVYPGIAYPETPFMIRWL